MPQTPDRTSILAFDSASAPEKLKDIRDNLSAIVIHQDNLWLGGDEGTSVHRMTRDADGNYRKHVPFELKDLLRLPLNNPAEEIDIEGLDIDGDFLWLTGSHSAKRGKPKKSADNISLLGQVTLKGNRFTLGRIPLVKDGQDFKPGNDAARLDGDESRNQLIDALQQDHHLCGFVPRASDPLEEVIPSKDNGLDIEGLAVSGNRIFIGLRGPVLRGCAIILELQLNEVTPQLLAMESVGPAGALFFKHFLDLRGLGIRDLVIDQKDLLILAGPTMVLDGPVYLYRWKNALDRRSDTFVGHKEIERLISLPCGNEEDRTEGKEHPEGIALMKDPLSVMVCYDSPADERTSAGDRISLKTDIFLL